SVIPLDECPIYGAGVEGGCSPAAIIRRFPRITSHGRYLQPFGSRARRPGLLERTALLSLARGAGQAQVLLPVHVPVPIGKAAHGTRARLYYRRRASALGPH